MIPQRILALETSCDETGAAVLEKKDDKITVLSNVTATSLATHATTGGIIPENAARAQVEYIMPVIIEALIRSEYSENSENQRIRMSENANQILSNQIDAIAVTHGPGLVGSLLVGVEAAKTLSYAFNKPLIPVNHLLAHLYANFIRENTKSEIRNSKLNDNPFPFVGLIVSGGHTDLLYFKSHIDYQWLGGTRDDAAGEALDKIGRILGLSYPAGPEIERRAKLVNNPTIKFKSPLINSDDFDFSFSGLKTEAMRYVQSMKISEGETGGKGIPSSAHSPNEVSGEDVGWKGSPTGPQAHEEHIINNICFAVQKAVIDVLVKKTLRAAEKFGVETILIGGGVSANETLIKELSIHGSQFTVIAPKKEYTTDNAAMIGAYALINPTPIPWQEVKALPELYFE